MSMDALDNLLMLAAAIIGLLICMFRYIAFPKRGWLYLSVFFLADMLSDYYWTIYSLVMNDSPDVSAIIAYIGWNLGYLILLLTVLRNRPKDCAGYFHPLMLLPIPLNAYQFSIYISFGGFFNNLWQCGFSTAIACFCLQALLYWHRFRKDASKKVHFPYLHTTILFYIITQYAMWTASCFDWESEPKNPYYYFAFAGYVIVLFFGRAAAKDYKAEGLEAAKDDYSETRSQILLQMIVTCITIGCCFGGYYLALWMKKLLPEDLDGTSVYNIIALVLFLISVFLVLVILTVIYMVAQRYKLRIKTESLPVRSKRNHFNLVFTIIVTLLLMIFATVYNSIIYYRASVTAVYDAGEDKAVSTATDLENYLTKAMSTLKVTADSIELMLKNGDSQEAIEQYILDQTSMQANQLDENFTGLYGYIRGEYLDGLGWVPPEGYDASAREWYLSALAANGEVVIISPYVDAQTQDVVITITKMLEDGINSNVVSLDVIVNHIQETTEQVELSGNGYAMIVNRDGFIVSHKDTELNGQDFKDVYGEDVLAQLITTEHGRIHTIINDTDSTVFVSRVMEQWYVFVVVDNTDLFEDVRSQLVINVLVSLTIFALITFFYYLGYMNEQANNRKMEEMNALKQRQEYESEMLRLEKSAADEANKAKSKFLADMSHEIRTPINAILGMNQMILREADQDSLLEYAENIEVSGRNLLQLINSILDFSKIEDGKMEIIPVSYSVHALITYLVNSIQERAEAKGLLFTIDADPAIPSQLYGDDTRINQIILNLLTNAVKYTPEGSVTLTIRAEETTADKVLLYISVADTGIGIRESDMDRLFESFERLDEKKNHNIEGTGLGISITTSLLKLMDSELKVESTYGKGSVFSFELWQRIEDPKPLGDYRQPAVVRTEAARYHESFHAPDARILVVDDTRMNLTVAVNLLKKTKIQIDTALSGTDAIALARENAYDLILMDQRMPGMSGTQAMNAIKELPDAKNADTPFICLTADAIRGARERYISEGFLDYLTKPIAGNLLEQALLNYLPADKLETVLPDSTEDANEKASSFIPVLNAAGLDTASALVYCMDSEDFYKEILSQYIEEYDDRCGKLEEYLKEQDWENYSIIAHALKSSSRTIGANELAEKAFALEKASKESDADTVLNGHDELLAAYEDMIRLLRNALK